MIFGTKKKKSINQHFAARSVRLMESPGINEPFNATAASTLVTVGNAISKSALCSVELCEL